jgi:hypothetical protein
VSDLIVSAPFFFCVVVGRRWHHGWGLGLWKEISSLIWFIDSRPATTLGEYEYAGIVFPYVILAYCVQMEGLILCIVGPISPCANILDRYVSNPLSLLSSFVTFPSYRNS